MPIKVLERRVLRGPNLYSPRPAYLLVVDLQELYDRPSTDFPGFADKMVDLIPTLGDHRCSRGYRGGFVERLHEGTYMAHILEHTIIELQCLAGVDVGYGKAREVKRHPGCYQIVVSYKLEKVVQEAVWVGIRIVESLCRGEMLDIAEDLDNLRYWAKRHSLGPSTAAIVEAAARRGIPTFRVTDEASLFQLGYGRYQRRIQAALTSETSHIAVDIASDKDLTNALLREAGLPVPRGEVVTRVEEALAVSRRMGRPVAVKPHYGNQGKGVTVNVSDPAHVEAAFHLAREYGRSVLVEEFIKGQDHRVLVVGDRVVAVARRLPAHVIGDGRQSIKQLMEEANTDSRRGTGHLKPLTKLKIDGNVVEVLQKQGCTPDSVPAEGAMVLLRSNANLSTGGTAIDLTDQIHPENAVMAVRAAKKVGLDVAGIDVVVEDISQPLDKQGGAIIEVNAAPGIRMHQHPSEGEPHDVGAAIIDMLYPPGSPTRIPIVAITGTNGKTTTALLVGHAIRQAGIRVGVTTTEGIYLDGKRVVKGDCTGYWSARTVLTDPQCEFAVLETARGGLFKRGMAFEWCDVGAVLNIRDDHLGQHGAESLEDLARVKRLLVQRAKGHAVLNADDAHCREMAQEAPEGTKVTFFSTEDRHPVVEDHLMKGGTAVYLRRNMIMVAVGEHRMPLVEVERIPVTLRGRARHNVENLLAAVAILIHAGLSHDQIVSGVASFQSTIDQNPGRLNMVRVRDFTVLIDYAHNPDSYRAICETVAQMERRRLIGVITAPGDRYDEKLEEVGRICAGTFDELVVREMTDLRGRQAGEVAGVIKRGVESANFSAERLHVVLQEAESINYGMSLAREGDLVVIGCADTEEAIATVLRQAEGYGPAPSYPVSMPPVPYTG
ncbi:MAG: cyanophycin synthetase [Candidatus Sericytochromatia bacterium]|nr:cyanophycin synthetase [Candidatus Tanganyikabacteria bacterium]